LVLSSWFSVLGSQVSGFRFQVSGKALPAEVMKSLEFGI